MNMNAEDYIAKLKPCPFCGGKAELIKTSYVVMGMPIYSVKCPMCSYYIGLDASADAAIEAWNTRSGEA